jgi:hypothetical protein
MRAIMPLHRFPEEFQCGFSIPALGGKGFPDFAFVIDGPPEVVGEAVDLHVDRVQVPAPVGQGPHSIHPLEANLRGEHRAKSVPPEAHRLMTDLNTALI